MKKGWDIKKLSEVMSIERGGSPRPIQKYLTNSPEGINWVKISDATASDKYIYETQEKITREGLHKTRIVYDGDFILSNSMSFGRPYIMKTTGCIHDGWLVLRNRPEFKLDKDFLYYLLSSPYVFQQFNRLAAGSTVRNLNIRLVSSVNIPIPPLPEQKRIVAILDEVFVAIAKAKENTEKNLQNAKDLFQSELNSIFTNTDKGWVQKKLRDVLQKTETINPLNKPNEEYIYIDVSSVNKETLLIEETSLIKGKNAPSRARKLVKTNDVIFATVRPTLKRIALISEDFNNQICSTGYFVLRASELIHFPLLFYYLQTFYFQDKMEKLQKGASYPAVTDNEVREQLISFPIDKNEQKKIAYKLDAIATETNKLQAIYQQKLNDVEELKKSILERAFKGELKTEKALIEA